MPTRSRHAPSPCQSRSLPLSCPTGHGHSLLQEDRRSVDPFLPTFPPRARASFATEVYAAALLVVTHSRGVLAAMIGELSRRQALEFQSCLGAETQRMGFAKPYSEGDGERLPRAEPRRSPPSTTLANSFTPLLFRLFVFCNCSTATRERESYLKNSEDVYV
jgi:hypothetical protein